MVFVMNFTQGSAADGLVSGWRRAIRSGNGRCDREIQAANPSPEAHDPVIGDS